MKKTGLFLMIGVLSGCASLQPRVEDVSLQSYEQGCALRGIQKGMTPQQAQDVCRCHTERAIALSSRENFLRQVELVGRADEAQRQEEEFQQAVAVMKSTFNECRREQGLLSQ